MSRRPEATVLALRCMLRSFGCVLIASGPVGWADELAGSEWRPLQIGATSIDVDTPMFVRFEGGGNLVGAGGCNRFFGTYSYADGALTIGPLATTRMTCDEDVMSAERALLETLEGTHRIERARFEMTIRGDDDGTVGRFLHVDAD